MINANGENSGLRMTLDISKEERSIAKEIKKEFKSNLKKLSDALAVILELRDALVEERPNKEDLRNKYRGRLVRYRAKVRNKFNSFLAATKKTLEKLSQISDPEMVKLREVIIAEIGEMSDGAEAILDLLDESSREGFTQTLERLAVQMEKRERSIIEAVDNQLFSHIDHDILGRMKISEIRFNIRKRSRIIKQLIRGK